MTVGKIERDSVYPRIAQNEVYVAGASRTINISSKSPYNVVQVTLAGRMTSDGTAGTVLRTLFDLFRQLRLRSSSQKDIFNGTGLHLFMLQSLFGHGAYEACVVPTISTATYFELTGLIPCHTSEGEGNVQLDVEFNSLANVFDAHITAVDAVLEISCDFVQKLYGIGYSWEGTNETTALAGVAGATVHCNPIAKDSQKLHTIIMLPLHGVAGLPSPTVGVKSQTGRWTLSDGTADVFNQRFIASRGRAKMNTHTDPREIAAIRLGMAAATLGYFRVIQEAIVFEQFAPVPANTTNRLTVTIDANETDAWDNVFCLYGFKAERQ